MFIKRKLVFALLSSAIVAAIPGFADAQRAGGHGGGARGGGTFTSAIKRQRPASW